MTEEAVLLWDGACAYCRRMVRRWLGAAPRGLRASPWQDEPALVSRLGLEEAVQATVVLVEGDRIRTRSTAAVVALWRQGGLRRLLAALVWLVPRPLRDAGYDHVARTRHRR